MRGAQDMMVGCVSDETELCHASHTLDGYSLEEEIDRRVEKEENDGRKNADMWWLRPSASGGARLARLIFTSMRGCGDDNSFEEEMD